MPPHPSDPARPRPPSFRRQASLILLPLALLVGFSLFSLRQDRLLVEQDARDRASDLALDLAQRLQTALAQTNPPLQQPSLDFTIDGQGQIVDPPPSPPLIPNPNPLDLSPLADPIRALWLAAEALDFATPETPGRTSAWHRVLENPLPPRLATAATYNLGVALTHTGNPDDANRIWDQLTRADPSQTTENGLPYPTLARWQRLQTHLTNSPTQDTLAPLLLDVCSNLVLRPSPLTEPLLSNLAAIRDQLPPSAAGEPARWTSLWRQHQQARALHHALLQQGLPTVGNGPQPSPPPSPNALPQLPCQLWIYLSPPPSSATPSPPTDPPTPWLVLRTPTDPHRCRCLPETTVRQILERVIAESPRLQPYLAASIEIAGRTFHPSPSPVLAARTSNPPTHPADAPWVRVSIHLTDPTTLFARQRRRSLWLGALVLAAATVACLGLFTAHRAFARQLRLNELRANFVSAASHELRAPIASVRLLAESLERDRVPDAAKRHAYYRLIGQECRRLSSLIENVLDFSRIDQGRKQYTFEPTDLPALLDHTLALMRPYAHDRQVTLELDSSPAIATLEPVLDGKAIQQALVNLIDNAVKHAPAHSNVLVSCRLRPTPPTLTLAVADHGPGVPPEDRTRIFQPFYRRGSELRRETPGIGIGLTIVQHVAQAHHGTVQVESTPTHPCEFTLTLPLSPPSNSHFDPGADRASAPEVQTNP